MNILIKVFGCTANQSDASIARYLLKNIHEYSIVNTIDDADIVILFTCTVISATEQRMVSLIKQIKKLNKKIIVTGCMASIQSDLIKNIHHDIICISPQRIHHLLTFLNTSLENKTNIEKYMVNKDYSTIIAPIAISEGCDFSCNYCITTLARGKLISYPISIIKNHVEQAIKKGCKEIQITAQDAASYRGDNGSSLAELLNELIGFSGWYRLRIGMMNPATLFPQLDNMITTFQNPHIYNFLHIPVQSGDNELLQLMGRIYTIEDFKAIVTRFRKHIPNITISTDIIVGFPSETETQFNNSKNLLIDTKPDIVNITKFSARPYTKAKIMKNRIPTDIVKKRSKELTRLVASISKEKNRILLGKEYSVVVTEKGKHQSMIGRTDQYKVVVLNEAVSLGDVVNVDIVDVKETYLVGMLK